MALVNHQSDVVVRAYRVTLSPEPGLEYDPFTVTASYAMDDPALVGGPKHDPLSDACRKEVQRIANKKERKYHKVPEGVVYDLANFELLREFVIPKEQAR
jgi:hypothetical protein